jgi:hypothetical protein
MRLASMMPARRLLRRELPPLIVAMSLVVGAAAAGEPPTDGAAAATAAEDAPAPPDSADADGGATLIPLPILFYTPETETGFGTSAIYYFHPGGAGAATHPSAISAIFIYTTKKQLVAQMEADVYLPGDDYQFTVSGGGVKFPNTFWGLGNDAPDEAEEDFTPRVFEAAAEVRRRVAPGWHVGLDVSFADRTLKETEEGGLLATKAIPGVDDGRVVQAGVVVARDTRDNILSPTTGALHEARGSLATGSLGSDYEFASWTIDSRTFRPLPGAAVLGVRALWMTTDRTPPFDLLPQLGGEDLLRGYYGGRYRDRALLAGQLEVRRHLWWRLGAVAFVAAGQVANTTGEFRLDAFRFAGGCGGRFCIGEDEGASLRADLGLGEGGAAGFYVGFGEVF